MIKDPIAMEVEAEADRELLCEKIIAKLMQGHQAQLLGNQNFGAD
jgi:hypothetical protein